MLRLLGRYLLQLYYRLIFVRGRENLPRKGPLLLVANHPNSLIDPVVIGAATRRKIRFLAKAPLFDIPVFGDLLRALGMVPVYRRSDDPTLMGRNTEMLAEAAKALVRGEWVGIFPEEKSHDLLKLEQVKGGAARIAQQAFEEGARELQIVPVGLNYEEKDRFRSTVWVEIGTPLAVASFFAEGGDARAQQRVVSEQIAAQLKELVIHLENPSWEEFLPALEYLVPHPAFDPLERIAQRKWLAGAINHFAAQEREHAQNLASRILGLKGSLQKLGLRIDSDLLRLRGMRLVIRQSLDLLYIVLASLPSLIGGVGNLLPYLITRPLSRVFIEPGRSTVVFYRLLVGIPVYLVCYALVWYFLSDHFTSKVASVVVVMLPFLGLFATSFWGRLRRFVALWWNEFWMLGCRARLSELREVHSQLSRDLAGLAARFGTDPKGRQRWQAPERAPIFLRVLRVVAPLSLLVLGFLLWIRPPAPSTLSEDQFAAEDLRLLSERVLRAEFLADEGLLKTLQERAEVLEREARGLIAEFSQGKRSYYHDDDEREIRRQMLTFLTLRAELMRLSWRYRGFERLTETASRERAFLIGLAASSLGYSLSSKLVRLFADDPLARKKLNEGEPSWGIPADLYDTVRARLDRVASMGELRGAYDRYQKIEGTLTLLGLDAAHGYENFHAMIALGRKLLSEHESRASVEIAAEGAEKEFMRTVYGGQAFISTWLGDTRIRRVNPGQALIHPQELTALAGKLKPGDILIERQNWFLSRAFMPGYWAHAALYVGGPAELRALGLDSDPRVKGRLSQFSTPSPSGHNFVIVEAVPRGVRFNTLEDCIGIADSAAVLRPKLAPEQIKEAIARAFSHVGKPYDFNFDFFSSDKLVCTELVYRAFDKFLKFPLVDVLGRKTLPPTELVRLFASKRNTSDAQFDFVAFLDGIEGQGTAVPKGEEEFAKTVERSSLTWAQEGK